jgi:uncharacterized protein (TIGR02996 family)
MIATDGSRLAEALEADPFNITLRLIYADFLEENGRWEHAAHRETARLLRHKSQVMDLKHPFARLVLRLDAREFKGNPIKPEKNKLTVVFALWDGCNAMALAEDGDWAVHPKDGYRWENLKKKEYRQWFLVDYVGEKQDPTVTIHPNLFADILIQEGYGNGS